MTLRSQLAADPGGIFFLGDWPDDEATVKGWPFLGSDGHLLSRALRTVGLVDTSNPLADYLGAPLAETRRLLWERRAHSFACVLRDQPARSDLRSVCASLKEASTWDGPTLPSIADVGCLRPEHYPALRQIAKEIAAMAPNIVVCLGALPLWLLTGHGSTDEWRGAVRSVPQDAPIMLLASEAERRSLASLKLLPTYGLSRVNQQYKLLVPLVADLTKVRHEADFPEIRPLEIAVWLEPELVDLDRFYERHVATSDLITLDIETAVGQIVCVQVGTDPSTALVLPFVDYRKPSRSYWSTEWEELAAWEWLARVCETATAKLGQNFAAYDLFWLLDRAGTSVRNYRHDLRLIHHILQPELPKSLAFMGSMYTGMPKWKANVHHGGTDDKRDS